MPKKLPVGGFWLVEETSQFSKRFHEKAKITIAMKNIF